MLQVLPLSSNNQDGSIHAGRRSEQLVLMRLGRTELAAEAPARPVDRIDQHPSGLVTEMRVSRLHRAPGARMHCPDNNRGAIGADPGAEECPGLSRRQEDRLQEPIAPHQAVDKHVLPGSEKLARVSCLRGAARHRHSHNADSARQGERTRALLAHRGRTSFENLHRHRSQTSNWVGVLRNGSDDRYGVCCATAVVLFQAASQAQAESRSQADSNRIEDGHGRGPDFRNNQQGLALTVERQTLRSDILVRQVWAIAHGHHGSGQQCDSLADALRAFQGGARLMLEHP